MSVDLRTHYLGLELRNPVVPSASPMGQRIDTLRALQDAGAAAVVLPSLFEEQIEHDEIQLDGALEVGTPSFAEALTYLPELGDYTTGTETYLRHLEETKRELEIPVIGSLNGITIGGWIGHAKRIQEAGADALELNVYFIAADPEETSDAVEERYVELVEAVRAEITIPLAVKMGPFFSSVGHMAHRMVASGADVLKVLLAGADVAMMASALLHEGPGHVATVLHDVETWLEEHGYESVAQMKGSMSQANIPNPVAYARANYAQLVTSFVSPYDWRMAEPEGELRA